MQVSIRKGLSADLEAVCKVYDSIHAATERGDLATGWVKGVYPVKATAREALTRANLFVVDADGQTAGTGIINKIQLEVYRKAHWQYVAPDEKIMVLHTFMIDPVYRRLGLGKKFIEFYENYAVYNKCNCLRLDTNALNAGARAFYKNLGYREAGVFECEFNNLGLVKLVMIEKELTHA